MKNSKAQRVAQTGLLFALAITLSWLESGIAPLLGLMPAMKLGLANMVVMYALLFLPLRAAWALVFLKALFALLTRGATAGFLSLCGGVLSLLVLLGLLCVPFQVSGYMFCVSGALAHNLGQLLGAAGILSSAMALAYETKGCDLYHNQEMLADIKDAVKFVYDNHFNPSIPRYGNWFSWQIGAPIYLGETLMLLYDEFTPEEIEKAIAAYS